MQIGRLQRGGRLVGKQGQGSSIRFRKRSYTMPTLLVGDQQDASGVRFAADGYSHQMTGARQQVLLASEARTQYLSHLGIVQRQLRHSVTTESMIEHQPPATSQE